MNDLRPPAFCMKELLLHLVLEVPNCPLGDFILKMGFYAAVADVLVVSFAVMNEHAVSKLACCLI